VFSIALAVGVYFTADIYEALNHGPAVLHLSTPIDDAIPLTPIFVIPYVSLEPLIYGTLILLLLFRTRIFQAACLSMILTWFVSYGFYIFLQSEMIRPELVGTDTYTMMIREVYAGDSPFNCFPSLHTSLSTLMAIHWVKWEKRSGIVVSIWVALIVLSTMLVKQHYVADVISGLALAFGSAWLIERAWGWWDARQKSGAAA
jgi:membrane-associated phospholipid phosphatase